MKLSAQTVLCHDRNMWVREIIDENGDCVAELSVETTQEKLANRNEALFLAAPQLVEALEMLVDEFCKATPSQLNERQSIALTKATSLLNKVG